MGACLAEEKSHKNKKLTIAAKTTRTDNKCVDESRMKQTLEGIYDQYDQDGNGFLERKEIV